MIQPFRFWCQKVLPLVYDDSLSYYELLCKVISYLNNVITDLNTTIGRQDELEVALAELKSYVENYFNNLDVQQEINNKLDQMVQEGYFKNLVEQYLSLLPPSQLTNNISAYAFDYNAPYPKNIVKLYFPTMHNAFPNLTYFNNMWYLFYRKATGHLSYDGKLYYISASSIGNLDVANEKIFAELPGIDLGECITTTYNNNLYILTYGRSNSIADYHNSSYYITFDGSAFSSPVKMETGIETCMVGGDVVKRDTTYYIPWYAGSDTGILTTTDFQTYTNLFTLKGYGDEATICFNTNENKWYYFIDSDKTTKFFCVDSLSDVPTSDFITLPFWSRGPRSNYVNKNVILMGRREQGTLAGYLSELNVYTFNNGQMSNVLTNLRAGNNTDLGYGNIRVSGSNGLTLCWYMASVSGIFIQQFNFADDFMNGIQTSWQIADQLTVPANSVSTYNYTYPIPIPQFAQLTPHINSSLVNYAYRVNSNNHTGFSISLINTFTTEANISFTVTISVPPQRIYYDTAFLKPTV